MSGGQVLFSFYINDLLEIPLEGYISSFADDAMTFYKGETWITLKKQKEIDPGTSYALGFLCLFTDDHSNCCYLHVYQSKSTLLLLKLFSICHMKLGLFYSVNIKGSAQ